MHFTRGPDKNSPPLQTPNQRPIVAPKTIRWLGFFLDHHLGFTPHTNTMANHAIATIRAMGILRNTIRGISHVQLQQLTLLTIIPVLTYGCQMWWGRRYDQLCYSYSIRLHRLLPSSPVLDHIPPPPNKIRLSMRNQQPYLIQTLPSRQTPYNKLRTSPTLPKNHSSTC